MKSNPFTLLLIVVAFFACSEEDAVMPELSKSEFDLAETEFFANGRTGGNRPIVFSRANADFTSGNIFMMNADGSGETQLTDEPGFNINPDISTNRKRIVFESDRDGDNEIFVMNADGTGQTQLTDNSSFDKDPVWSTNGQYIAFASNRSGAFEVYVMNADGTNQRQVTDVGGATWPSWSPDGKQLAYEFQSGFSGNVFVTNVDGSGTPVNVTNGFKPISGVPTWSPNGKQIAFHAFDFAPTFKSSIYIIDADGQGTPTQLTDEAGLDFFPDWSTAGIVFARNVPPGQPDIYRIDADGSGLTNLTDNPLNDAFPSW